MARVDGPYDFLYGCRMWDAVDPWKKRGITAPPFPNDLTEMGPGMGYRIRASRDCTWSVS